MSDYDRSVPHTSRPSITTAATTEERILKALFELKNPMPHEIKKYLDDEKTILFEPKPISLRHIQRVVKKLSNEGIVVHVDGRYSISQADLRYVGGLFGHLALSYIFHRPHLSTKLPIDESLRKLVTGFGVFVFYMFVEASRPIEKLGIKERRDSVKSWLQNSVPISDMFAKFIVMYSGGLRDLFKYGLKKDTIHKLTQALEELYPYEYKQMQIARNLLTSRVSGNLHELRKGLPDYLSRTGESIRRDEVDEQLRLLLHIPEGADFGEFLYKLTHPEESKAGMLLCSICEEQFKGVEQFENHLRGHLTHAWKTSFGE